MASPAVASALQDVQAAPTASKPAQYTSILGQIIASIDNLTENLSAYARTLLDDSIGIVQLRPLLAAFADAFRNVKDPDIKIEVGEKVVSLLQSKGAGQYEEQDTSIKEGLAEAYEANEDFRRSAQILASINLESTQKSISALSSTVDPSDVLAS